MLDKTVVPTEQVLAGVSAVPASPAVIGGHDVSSIPAEQKEEVINDLQDDWEDDPANARNWSPRKKWICVTIVSICIDRFRLRI